MEVYDQVNNVANDSYDTDQQSYLDLIREEDDEDDSSDFDANFEETSLDDLD